MKTFQNKRTQSSTSGFSILEVVLATAIMALVFTAAIAGLQQLLNTERRVRIMVREDQLTASIIANVRANLHVYLQSSVPYLPDDTPGATAKPIENHIPNELPIAFSNQIFTTPELCPDCPGRIGIVIQPLNGMPSMYRVLMRVTHKEIYANAPDNTKDIDFIAAYR